MRYTKDKNTWQKKKKVLLANENSESEVYHMKTRKLRLLSALLALAMLLALLPTAAFADNAPGGNCGAEGNEENVHWTLDSDGTLTISGTGAMADYGFENISSFDINYPWKSHILEIKKIVIQSGVTRIGNYAFYALPNITSVSLPDGVKSIGEYAFSGWAIGGNPAPKIEEIKIPASVTDIEDVAFGGCEKLKTISFEADSKLVKIGVGAFCNCSELYEVTIPASVTTIGSQAFTRCSDLQSVTFAPGSKLETIGENAFSGCSKLETISCESALKEKLSGVVSEKIISVTHWNVKFVTDANTTTELVENNKPVAERTAPAKDGYIFAGWYTKDANDKWADKPFDFSKAITDDTTLYARWGVKATPIGPAIRLYPITIDYGTAYDAEGNPITKAAAGDVVTIEANETALEGMAFERWEVRKGEVKLENDRAAKTSFTMPEGEVQLEAMYQAADVHDSGWDAATVVTGAVIGTGTAILAYHIGMEVYAEQVLGKDVAVPRTRSEVALLAWQLAGSPAVNVEGEPLSEAAQAERWAVESGLMEPDAEGNFNGTKKMSKWNALRTLDAAKKQG